MDITLRLHSDKMDDEDLQALTRELCEKINDGGDLAASLPTLEIPNAKGTLIELGVFVLSFVGMDGAKVLLGFIKDLLMRESQLELEIIQPDGTTFKINAKNKSSQEIKALLEQLQ